MKIGTVREKPVHVRHPFVDLNFGANRTKATFAGSWNMAYFLWVIRAGKRGEAEAIRFPAVYDFPNVIGRIPPNQRLVDVKE